MQDHLDQWVYQELQEKMVNQDQLDQKDYQDQQDQQELMGNLVNQVNLDFQEMQEKKVYVQNIAPSMEEYSSKMILAVKQHYIAEKFCSILHYFFNFQSQIYNPEINLFELIHSFAYFIYFINLKSNMI